MARWDALASAFENLDAVMSDVAMPAAMKAILRRQRESIISAIRIAKLRGAKPLCDAVRAAAGDVALHAPILDKEVQQAQPEAKNAFAKGMELLKKAADIGDRFSKIKNAGQDLGELAGYVAPLAMRYGPVLLGHTPTPLTG